MAQRCRWGAAPPVSPWRKPSRMCSLRPPLRHQLRRFRMGREMAWRMVRLSARQNGPRAGESAPQAPYPGLVGWAQAASACSAARGVLQRGMTEPASPCTGVCRIEPATGWCTGCWRSISEITAWPALTDDGKRAILAGLCERRESAAPVVDEAPAGAASLKPARSIRSPG